MTEEEYVARILRSSFNLALHYKYELFRETLLSFVKLKKLFKLSEKDPEHCYHSNVSVFSTAVADASLHHKHFRRGCTELP